MNQPKDFDPSLLTLNQQFELAKIQRNLESKSVEELKASVLYLSFKLMQYQNTAKELFKENFIRFQNGVD